MQIFGANTTTAVLDLFREKIPANASLQFVNEVLYQLSGLINCFSSEEEWGAFRTALTAFQELKDLPDRTEFGDFQTPAPLADKIVKLVADQMPLPEVLIEPTCGKGIFVLSALQQFPTLKFVYALDIYRPYVWETKFSIIELFLNKPWLNKPDIQIFHGNVFDFDFCKLVIGNRPLLVIGNPPWVTNAMLGVLHSDNLPPKTNFKQLAGIDAVTGKGNFDIAENILLIVLKAFEQMPGRVALLVKNSVVRNIMLNQFQHRFAVNDFRQYSINSLREFDVRANASLFCFQLGQLAAFTCSLQNFYRPGQPPVSFGWQNDRFVSDTISYKQYCYIDGTSPLEWRQGLKHDCASVMELEREGSWFRNAKLEKVELEEGLVYGLLKSSDLQQEVVREARKYTIVTQQKPGADTGYIEEQYPASWQYLNDHKAVFSNRRSAIYKKRPPFSIFGIGSYSFKPYKVAISGLYKSFRFTLVLPLDGKPLMLDDTCYMLGFDELDFAVYTYLLLNSPAAAAFLRSISFPDAKRTFTKEILMRVNLHVLATAADPSVFSRQLNELNLQFGLQAGTEKWNAYLQSLCIEKAARYKPDG